MTKYEVEFFETIRHALIINTDTKEEAEQIGEKVYYEDEENTKVVSRYSKPLENSIGMTKEVKE